MRYTLSIIDPGEQVRMLASSGEDGLPSHCHSFYEIAYVRSGQGLHCTEGHTVRISAGDVILIHEEDAMHSLQPLKGDGIPFSWVNCLFLDYFIKFDWSFFKAISLFKGMEHSEMDHLFQAMTREYKEKREGYLDALRSYLRIALIRLMRQSTDNNGITESYVQRKKTTCVKQAIEEIHRNEIGKIGLKELSNRLGVSATYLNVAFREARGMSVGAYVRDHRLRLCAELLTEGQDSVADVARLCGYSDMKTFYTQFKIHFGMTPGDYRIKFSS
ncbi:MAG: transcriptional regulator, AraC family [Paenibacillaceae bacterium]|jgi:AraC-like DNA-binding protein|nr:transcriptional regulator, AraC family [Paenibacillaceae bacterium]